MSDNNTSGGIGFFGLLAIVFITLKLCEVITWSWWWITAPLWGPLVFIVAFLIAAFICVTVFYLIVAGIEKVSK